MNARFTGRSLRDRSGQAFVFTLLFITVIVGFAAVTVDGGSWLFKRRNLQGVADAAAMAGVNELPTSQADAASEARRFITTENSADRATELRLDVDSDEVTVEVYQDTGSWFAGVLGSSGTRVTARAQGELAQVTAIPKMLPFGLVEGQYALGANLSITAENPESNRGTLTLREGVNCLPDSGADALEEFIRTAEYGGTDACPTPVNGATISTKPGGNTQKVRNGFDARIDCTHSGNNNPTCTNVDPLGRNGEANGVFEWDVDRSVWLVKNPSSRRFGIMPVIEDPDPANANWPNGNIDVKIKGFVFVYIGKESDAGNFMPWENVSNQTKVYMTPLGVAILPSAVDLGAKIGPYDPTRDSPLVYRLAE